MKKLQLLLGVALLVAVTADNWLAPVAAVLSSSSGISECERGRQRA